MMAKPESHTHIYKPVVSHRDGDDDEFPEDKVILKPVVGIFGSISFIMGSIIGTGIFLSPTGVLEGVSGSVGWSLVMWAICAIAAACGAYCYVELATIFKKSGGDFTFMDEIYGPMVGYVRVWIMFFMGAPVWSAVQCIVVATYVTTPFFPCSDPPYAAVRLLSICVFLITVFINCYSTVLATRAQIVYTIAKSVGLVVIILSGMVLLCQGETENFKEPFQPQEDFDMRKLPGALYAGLFAYSGWSFLIFIVEEVEKPNKILPTAMNISLAAVTILYLLANISYLTAMTPQEILSSDAVAADYAVRVLGSWSWLIWVFVAISALGSFNSGLYSRSRMIFAASREKRFPRILSFIHINYRTPTLPIILPIPLTLVMLCWANVWFLINFMGFVETIFMTMCFCIIPYVRWKHPEREIPFKTNITISIVAIVANIFLIVLTIISVPIDCLIGVCFIAVAIAIYYMDRTITAHPDKYSMITDKVNDFLQRLFLSVPQEEKTY